MDKNFDFLFFTIAYFIISGVFFVVLYVVVNSAVYNAIRKAKERGLF